MTISHQKFRETVFLLLFSKDFHDSDEGELSSLVSDEIHVPKSALKAAQTKLDSIQMAILEIDAIIQRASITYDFHRIQRVERTILRLAVYELLYEKELSSKVIIAEAKRLAKKFSTPEASGFCQAILDAISKGQ